MHQVGISKYVVYMYSESFVRKKRYWR